MQPNVDELMNKKTGVTNDVFLKSDADFNELYPLNIQRLAKRHWTPLHIVNLAVSFLARKNARILDIGSGVGKFCLAGACYAPEAQFYGIEQREHLIQHARHAQKKLNIRNASFLHGNFTSLNFKEFDHFYFFNSFYENIDSDGRIDNDIEYSESLYEYYMRYLYNELRQMPKGTRIATYHHLLGEIPIEYDLVDSYQDGDLNFWIKR